ncbi:MAG: hypothetical protein ACR2ID_00545 [Chthoniobacterales bacterium]
MHCARCDADLAGKAVEGLCPVCLLDGPEQTPYVSDFGIAKWMGRESALTLFPTALGTPHYVVYDARTVTLLANLETPRPGASRASAFHGRRPTARGVGRRPDRAALGHPRGSPGTAGARVGLGVNPGMWEGP